MREKYELIQLCEAAQSTIKGLKLERRQKKKKRCNGVLMWFPWAVGYLLSGSRPRGFNENWQGRGRGEGVCFALVVRDGLLECPNCRGDHFTTLRAPQKNLFSSALARLGRTGLFWLICHLLLSLALPAGSLLLPRLRGPRGAPRRLERSESGFEDEHRSNKAPRKVCLKTRRIRTEA